MSTNCITEAQRDYDACVEGCASAHPEPEASSLITEETSAERPSPEGATGAAAKGSDAPPAK